MSNDRSRNQHQLSPHASKPAALPPIPAVRREADLVPFAIALKQHIDARTGSAGNPFEKWQTLRNLAELGLTGSPALKAMPRDFAGHPVITSQGKYVMLSQQALVDAIAAQLGDGEDEDPEVSKQEFDALVQRVSQIRPGISAEELAQYLTALRGQLTVLWRADIAAALDGLSAADIQAAINNALNVAMQALHLAQTLRGFVYEQPTAALIWSVAHRLDRYPSVTVMNTEGEKIEPDVEFVDFNTVLITHGRATAGKAVFR